MNNHGKIIAIGAFTVLVSAVASAEITRVSVTSTGGELSKGSIVADISGNGRFISFQNDSPELGASNSEDQAFIYDTETGNVILVSESINGGVSNDYSYAGKLSYDGTYTAFVSSANDIVSGITGSVRRVYVKDIETGTTQIASTTSDGTVGNSFTDYVDISGSGDIVVFDSYSTNLAGSDTNSARDIFLKNMTTGDLSMISRPDSGEGNGHSFKPSISSDGKIVAFISSASNLVSGDTNSVDDAFIYNSDTDEIERISVSSSGTEANARTHDVKISPNGRYVIFVSDASNLVTGDNEGQRDVFLRDLKNGTTLRVSTTETGLGFSGMSQLPSISADGRYVAFGNNTTVEREVPGGGINIYLKDVVTGSVNQIDIGLNNTSYIGSGRPFLSDAGDRLAFYSAVPNLISSDTNGTGDVFLKDFRYQVCE